MPDADLDLSADMFRSGTTPKSTTITMQRRLQGPVNRDVSYTESAARPFRRGHRPGHGRGSPGGRAGSRIERHRDHRRQLPLAGRDHSLRDRDRGVFGRASKGRSSTAGADPLQVREADHRSGLHLVRAQDGCWSRVGEARGTDTGRSRLGPGCGLGSAIHEIGHTIGLWHEQSRADRDDIVEIVQRTSTRANPQLRQAHSGRQGSCALRLRLDHALSGDSVQRQRAAHHPRPGTASRSASGTA